MRRVVLVVVIALCVGHAAAADIAFSDQTAAAGLVHTSDLFFDMNGQGMFNGGAVGDFNRDGWPDLFLLGGGNTPDSLYINDGDGAFTNRAADWGVETLHRGRGATAGDFDNDGWPDIFVTSSGAVTGPEGVGKHILYRNNGGETFTDVAVAAGVNQASSSSAIATGAAFGDYDLDGDLDLFVCTWSDSAGNRLFRNDGDGTFSDVTVAAEIDSVFWGFSPRFVDMNGDRFPEIIVAADYYTSRYFVNDGDGTFTNASVTSGTGLEDNGMGNTVADFNRDGRPDWYVTSIYEPSTIKDGNYLYVNQGNDLFTVLPESAGARDGGWGWGTDAVDFDHDGFIDLVETNGWQSLDYPFESSYLFRNNGDMTFSVVSGGPSGFDHAVQGRSVLLLDYDRDGDMDVALTAFGAPVALFRNDISGPDANWVEILLDTYADPGLAPDGYGTRVVATTGSISQYFWVNGGATYLGRSQPVAHFGLGSATTVDLSIEWADGTTTELPAVPANQIVTVAPSVAGAPGEASASEVTAEQMLAAWDEGTGLIDLFYTPACDATGHTVYYGPLAEVSTYAYSGAACWCGNSGTTSFDPGGLTDAFFLIVGDTGLVEGSYGQDSLGAERPEDLGTEGCDLPRDLSATCNY